jgi:cytochrome P450
MSDRGVTVRFARDPLVFLDQAFPAAGDAAWLPGRQLCLGEAAAARSVLANAGGLYQEHSDFFHSRRGPFGPRSVQIAMGRAARSLLRARIAAFAGRLPAAVRQALVPTSAWPDAGNHLVYRHLAGALVAPDGPPRLRRTVDEIVERSVLAGAHRRRSGLAHALYRRRVVRELAQAVDERRQRRRRHDGGAAPEPADLLDVVAGTAAPDAAAAELAEVFASFVFAVAGSVGFALGWSIYLLGTHPGAAAAEPAWVVREALRLWPVAWLLARQPARPHEVAGVAVTPRDQVLVCPYLVHRDPRHWDEPLAFRPERWAEVDDHLAFIPFGWGPHRCVAAALALQLVEDVLRIIVSNYRLTLTCRDPRPHVGPALAPPAFILDLAPNRP